MSLNYLNKFFVIVDFACLFASDIIWSYIVLVAEDEVAISDIGLLFLELISPSV